MHFLTTNLIVCSTKMRTDAKWYDFDKNISFVCNGLLIVSKFLVIEVKFYLIHAHFLDGFQLQLIGIIMLIVGIAVYYILADYHIFIGECNKFLRFFVALVININFIFRG